MKKNEAINIIVQAAKYFNLNLRRKNFLIVFGTPNKPECIEARFPISSFVHLTGIVLNQSRLTQEHLEKKTNVNELFYEKAIHERISPSDFYFKSDGTTELKLSVLSQAIDILHNAKMIGDFKGNHCKLETDKLAGSVYSVLGFVRAGKYYVPNTVLAADTRDEVIKPQKVLAILSKEEDLSYSQIEYTAKKIDIQRLLALVSKTWNISQSLLREKADSVQERLAANHNEAPQSSAPQPKTNLSDQTQKDQDSHHVQQTAKHKPFTLSGAKRSAIAANAERAGHKEKPQQRPATVHKRDDDTLS